MAHKYFPCHMTHIHVCATTITPLLSITMEAEVITSFLPDLVNAIGDCVQPVSDQCLAKGLISHSTYKTILESDKKGEDKARVLIQAVISSTETEGTCLDSFLDSLDQVLPYVVKDKLLSEIKAKQDNTCKSVVPLSQTFQLVPSEQLPRETIALHTKLLGRFEDSIRQHEQVPRETALLQSTLLGRYEESIRQHERACAEKTKLEATLNDKSIECERLKEELEVLKRQTSTNDEYRANIQRRLTTCESEFETLKAKVGELNSAIEELGFHVTEGRNTILTGTREILKIVAQQNQAAAREKAQEQITDLESKLASQEKENIETCAVDRLKLHHLDRVIHSLTRNHRRPSYWKNLGEELGFSTPELEDIERIPRYKIIVKRHWKRILRLLLWSRKPDDWYRLEEMLRQWLQWYPGDSRGSSSFAIHSKLQTELVNIGHGNIACDLVTYNGLYITFP